MKLPFLHPKYLHDDNHKNQPYNQVQAHSLPLHFPYSETDSASLSYKHPMRTHNYIGFPYTHKGLIQTEALFRIFQQSVQFYQYLWIPAVKIRSHTLHPVSFSVLPAH